MRGWKQWTAAVAVGASVFVLAACDGGPDEVDQPGDPEQVEQVEEQLDQVEEDVRDGTP